jgi:hypothetical protein
VYDDTCRTSNVVSVAALTGFGTHVGTPALAVILDVIECTRGERADVRQVAVEVSLASVTVSCRLQMRDRDVTASMSEPRLMPVRRRP